MGYAAGMRAVLVPMILGCAAGCPVAPTSPPPDTSPWMDPGGPISFPGGCHGDDSRCAAGEVCARVGGCTPADQVRAIHINWTLSGEPANATTCDATRNLTLRISPPNSFGLGWAPVPCSQGKFTVDKISRSYSEVELNAEYSQDSPQLGTIDEVTGEVTIDLPF
jgi:hypothetical protein